MFSLKTASRVSRVFRADLCRRGFVLSRRHNGANNDDDFQEPGSIPLVTVENERNFSNSTSSEKTINSVTLLGRVGNNPIQRGSMEHPVVTFSLATNSNYRYSNGEIAQKSEWHRICVFKPGLRDSVYKFAGKGQRVLVQGRIIYGEFTDAGGTVRTTTSIVADDVIHFKNS